MENYDQRRGKFENNHSAHDSCELDGARISAFRHIGLHDVVHPIGQLMRSRIHRTLRLSENGYSMVELMISMAIFLIISSGLFGALGYYMKNYQRTQLTVDMHDNLRSAIDLMAQEIGQAGLLSSNTNQITTLGAAVATGSQTVAFGSAATIFVGEKLL